MKVKELIEMLEGYDGDMDIVIRTQKRHSLYGDIGEIEEHDNETIILDFQNEGYSPEQALRKG